MDYPLFVLILRLYTTNCVCGISASSTLVFVLGDSGPFCKVWYQNLVGILFVHFKWYLQLGLTLGLEWQRRARNWGAVILSCSGVNERLRQL